MVNKVVGAAPAQSAAGTDTSAASQKKGPEKLTLSKVLAGSMAAATSAVLGSYFGAFGTVGGAAVGSIATTVATNLYQRSIERTREHVKSRVQAVTGRANESDSAPLEQQRTVRLDPSLASRLSARRIYRSLGLLVGGTAMIFLVGLALVTGIEWAKGSPLSGGDSGTSVGRVFNSQASPPKPSTVHRGPTQEPSATHSSGASEEPTEPSASGSASSSDQAPPDQESTAPRPPGVRPSELNPFGSTRPSSGDGLLPFRERGSGDGLLGPHRPTEPDEPSQPNQ